MSISRAAQRLLVLLLTGATGMLVGAYHRAVHYDRLGVGVLAQRSQQTWPKPVAGPAPEARVNARPRRKATGQIAPRSTRAQDPQHRFDKPTVCVTGTATLVPFCITDF